MHGKAGYANRVTGRVVHYPDAIVLQYWLWSTTTQRAREPPKVASYSQHKGGESCPWSNVQRDANGHPIVYVAEGSHASYFRAGYHLSEGANDTANGNGEEVARPMIIDATQPPNWTRWPGHWGASGASPASPMQQGGSKWNDPRGWAQEVDRCSVATSAAATARPGVRRRSSINLDVPLPEIPVGTKRPGLQVAVETAEGRSAILRVPIK